MIAILRGHLGWVKITSGMSLEKWPGEEIDCRCGQVRRQVQEALRVAFPRATVMVS